MSASSKLVRTYENRSETVPTEYYTKAYYDGLREGATRSAEVIVPLVLQLLPVRSVVDVGCGEGAWLAAFRKFGVDDVLGVDRDYVDRNLLQVPQDRFQSADLSKPLSLPRTFDLAVSLEVAEHLPANCASRFVESLIRLAPVVLFSAAIPFQGGTQHLNEQWPDNWAELFKEHGYVAVDFIRKRVWQDETVEWWYAQNALLFVRTSVLEGNTSLKSEFERTNPDQLRLVHPRQYLYLESLYRDALDREAYLRAHPASGITAASKIFLECLKNAITFRVQSILGRRANSNGRTKP
jgi:SAM-dependent methyltransferase